MKSYQFVLAILRIMARLIGDTSILTMLLDSLLQLSGSGSGAGCSLAATEAELRGQARRWRGDIGEIYARYTRDIREI